MRSCCFPRNTIHERNTFFFSIIPSHRSLAVSLTKTNLPKLRNYINNSGTQQQITHSALLIFLSTRLLISTNFAAVDTSDRRPYAATAHAQIKLIYEFCVCACAFLPLHAQHVDRSGNLAHRHGFNFPYHMRAYQNRKLNVYKNSICHGQFDAWSI